MLKINKISITKIYENKELGNSRLELNIKGHNINYIIINTIRRVLLSDIPIYAFTEFKFDKNSSVFHNNYLKLRLSCLPIWGIENTIDYIDCNIKIKEYNNNQDQDEDELDDEDTIIDMDYNETNKNILTSLKQLTMYINYKNKTNNIISVTTNDAKFYCEEKQITSPYQNNIQLVKLQPEQEIAFSAITTIGTEQINSIYSAVSIVTYKEINSEEFNFILESRGQINEYRILDVALINIQQKIKNFLKLLQDTKNSKENIKDYSEKKSKVLPHTETISNEFIEGTIEVHNEDHTLGNLITRGLQQHKNVKFAGYNLTHPLAKIVIFHYIITKNTKIINILEDVINYYNELFSNINFEISHLQN